MQAKQALSLASLVAAIPAAVLTYFLVMVFIKSFENVSGVMMGIIAVTLICCALILFIPVAAMVFGGRRSASRETAIVADGSESAVDAKKSKASDETFAGDLEDEVPASTISDQSIELDEDAMVADDDLDDFETFDDLDDDRK
ncbi:MAG: hypothetical protein WD065_16680 [Planctomycetaceae bacterium]